jgi:hypothetical protein
MGTYMQLKLLTIMLTGRLSTLATQRVHTGWRNYNEDLPKAVSYEGPHFLPRMYSTFAV